MGKIVDIELYKRLKEGYLDDKEKEIKGSGSEYSYEVLQELEKLLGE